jgi:hypothetical protein
MLRASMPRNNAIIVADLVGKLAMLRFECAKCGRSGRYRLDKLAPNKSLIEFRLELTADCPRKIANKMTDQCGACCPDIPKVL